MVEIDEIDELWIVIQHVFVREVLDDDEVVDIGHETDETDEIDIQISELQIHVGIHLDIDEIDEMLEYGEDDEMVEYEKIESEIQDTLLSVVLICDESDENDETDLNDEMVECESLLVVYV